MRLCKLFQNKDLYTTFTYAMKTESTVFGSYSKGLLRHGVLRVFVRFCVLVYVWAILSWCP